jgi:adenylate kinase
MKRVILITGTPCIGKTALAKQLAAKLDAYYLNLTDYAKTNDLVQRKDKKRKTLIVNEQAMMQKLALEIKNAKKADFIVDGHYASAVVPPDLVSFVFVLRRNPVELKKFMQKCSFSDAKMNENLMAEILDVCLVEALEKQQGKVCELDVSGKTVEESLSEVLAVLLGEKKCYSGTVDWLGMLEHEGLTDQYLKV